MAQSSDRNLSIACARSISNQLVILCKILYKAIHVKLIPDITSIFIRYIIDSRGIYCMYTLLFIT